MRFRLYEKQQVFLIVYASIVNGFANLFLSTLANNQIFYEVYAVYEHL